jgi:diaminohydroxyphosphoribosylaminopyrimidine deaminase/5-amino-6-(5-phosphoribosylamino)uracil reductase
VTTDKQMLDLAARVAFRAAGHVEPNPMVGCVIARGSAVLGVGHHRVFGGPHAEVEAINDCVRRGNPTQGATMYVTLEPCAHHGKQPPCVDAVFEAGIARVVCARRDPNPQAAGGADQLAASGMGFEFTTISPAATHLSDPFVKRVRTGLPWVLAKWAQTIDGRVATRTGESKWISNDDSRRRVHRLRARVDAVLTAIGTILSDDPVLTARAGWRRRRLARRVVIDPGLEIPETALILQTIGEAPLTIVCADEALAAQSVKVGVLTALGAEVVSLGVEGEVDVESILRHLSDVHGATNVLVEAGPGLLGRLFDADLVDEAHVYIAPKLLADELAKPAARGRVAERLSDAKLFALERAKRIGDDLWAVYRRPSEP